MTMADRIVVMHDGTRRADRHAARALRSPGQPLRRRLHRLAGDELHQGHAAPQRRRLASSPAAACALPAAARCPGPRRAAGHLRRPARTPRRRRGGAGVAAQVPWSSRPAPRRWSSPRSAARRCAASSPSATISRRARASASRRGSTASICSMRIGRHPELDAARLSRPHSRRRPDGSPSEGRTA